LDNDSLIKLSLKKPIKSKPKPRIINRSEHGSGGEGEQRRPSRRSERIKEQVH
jgi:hypothetical protein